MREITGYIIDDLTPGNSKELVDMQGYKGCLKLKEEVLDKLKGMDQVGDRLKEMGSNKNRMLL